MPPAPSKEWKDRDAEKNTSRGKCRTLVPPLNARVRSTHRPSPAAPPQAQVTPKNRCRIQTCLSIADCAPLARARFPGQVTCRIIGQRCGRVNAFHFPLPWPLRAVRWNDNPFAQRGFELPGAGADLLQHQLFTLSGAIGREALIDLARDTGAPLIVVCYCSAKGLNCGLFH